MRRDEIVGKRFLSLSGCIKLKQSKISEWGWRAGVVRASSHKDNKHPDLQILVEFDDVEWHRREWISIHKDSMFHAFLVEDDLVWSDRPDPYNSKEDAVFWPALNFTALVDAIDMKNQLQPVEFLVDRELAFRDMTRIEPLLDLDQKLGNESESSDLYAAVRKWLEYQDGQRILLTTPSVLVGYRIEVYRAEGTTQWYTAVIVGYNESTKDLTVTDDTVLEEHNEDPALVQMRLIGDGVVESIMRGEVVGITPRRSRSAAVLAHNNLPVSRLNRVTPTRQSHPTGLRRPKVKAASTASEGATSAPSTSLAPSIQPASPPVVPSSTAAPIAERLHATGVEVTTVPVTASNKEQCGEPAAHQVHASEDRLGYESFPRNGDTNDEPSSIEVLREPAEIKGAAVQCSARDEIVIPRVSHDDADRMEEAGGTARFSDDRSDSGVSSLRSCSGDERSGSRSSALSSSDEPPQQPVTTRSPLCGEIVRVWRDPNLTSEPRVRHVQSVQHQSLLMSLPQSNSASQPAASSAPPPGVSVPAMAMVQAQSAHYQPPQLNPPLLTSHSMLQPPGLYSPMNDLMWNKGYRLPVHHMLGSPDELLRDDRERIYAQDRDRYRREQEVREIEKQKILREREIREREERERERERLERERKEQDRSSVENAVHKHFEDSLRLAALKDKWPQSVLNQLPLSREEDRKRVDDLQQRLMDRHRQERYFPARPASNPPPAHSRPVGGKLPALPKAEPNYNLFNYPTYNCRPEHKPLPTPPPLTMDPKSSVIVKNDGKIGHHLDTKVQAHSPKGQKFDYRPMEKTYRPPPLPVPHGMGHPRAPYTAKPATIGSYPYPSPSVRSKVSSPAPPHIYGKPTAGITTGIPVGRTQESSAPLQLTGKPSMPASTSPYQQVPLHQPPIVSPIVGPPPPAHSSKVGTHPGMHSVSPTLAIAPRNPPVFQTQPLDLGLSERSGSPKRRAPTPIDMDLSNKRPRQSPPAPPLLARVSEPSPLVAGAATTITTVVNTAAFPPEMAPSPIASPALRSSPGPRASPCPRASPGARASPCARASPGVSPGPAVSSATSMPSPTPRMPVHKVKKAWIHSYTQDGGDADSTASVGITEISANPRTEAPSMPSLTIPNAVNSVGKTPPKTGRKAVKDTLLNGHAADAKSDSSSSELDTRKSPGKRKAKVKKKKKTAKRVTDDSVNSNGKKKKGNNGAATATPVASDSSESERETGSDKDSDSGGSKRSANAKEPKKRGRRPKGSKNDGDEEPRGKRGKEEPSKSTRDPFRKPPIAVLKKTGETFLQDGPCFEVAPKLGKCRECRWTPNQRSKTMPNIFCRFYAFRRLRYTKHGQLAIAGFSDPHADPSEDDKKLWLPAPDNVPDLKPEMCRFILQHVGDHCCYLLCQERDAIKLSLSEEKTIAWKRVVQGVREMCDVCETTLFNFHWACGKCGFVVCIDCYKSRKAGIVQQLMESARDRDDYAWLQCTNRQSHELDKLMLTQIIAGDSMMTVLRSLHEVRMKLGIEQKCECPVSGEFVANGFCKDATKVKTEGLNGIRPNVKEEEKENKLKGNATTNGSTIKTEVNQLSPPWTGEEDKKPDIQESSGGGNGGSEAEMDKDGNFSTLRELLIRPASMAADGSAPPSPQSPHGGSDDSSGKRKAAKSDNEEKKKIKPDPDEVIPDDEKDDDYFAVERAQMPAWWSQGKRAMTISESRDKYPDIPHSWLCDSKLLRLLDPTCPGNLTLFKDQWGRGQPILVKDVAKNLNMALWQPSSFIEDFGDDKNDLVNCMNGKIVPNQPMRKFWEGFEQFSKRLKDERGNPMLLKLKDWPPTEDFAEMMPARFTDLMAALPLPEYTHRTGQYNLAYRLPDCFVRPDLGPKMYNAYGSAIHSDKGTTNLHLDVSDAVNVMVYVGIPKDMNYEEQVKESFRAIDEAGCDLLTRRRVREKGELPGALWHIYNANDAHYIRRLINKVKKEKGISILPNHDPIHDQDCYLDNNLRGRLYEEYGVQGYPIVQCLGDAVFIPAGAPHQVRNLHNCIKIAQDFVSVENVAHCYNITQELRNLSSAHLNREDKLQIKNIMYHSIKDSLSVMMDELRHKSPAQAAPIPSSPS